MKTVGQKLKELRLAQGLSQLALAKKNRCKPKNNMLLGKRQIVYSKYGCYSFM